MGYHTWRFALPHVFSFYFGRGWEVEEGECFTLQKLGAPPPSLVLKGVIPVEMLGHVVPEIGPGLAVCEVAFLTPILSLSLSLLLPVLFPFKTVS